MTAEKKGKHGTAWEELPLAFSTLLSNLQTALLVEDEQRKILLANQQFCDMFRLPFPPETLIGMDCGELAKDAKEAFVEASRVEERILELLEQKLPVYKEEWMLKDGRCLARDFIPIEEDGIFRGILWQYWDFSEQYQTRLKIEHSNKLLSALTQAQSEFIRDAEPRALFDNLLQQLLQLTESEYGFIGEVLFTDKGEPYLKTYAITNISWNEQTSKFYEENAPQGMEFYNLKTLFGTVMTSRESVIANEPKVDPRRGGLPEGHPALNCFLGVPFLHGTQIVGMFGIANRAGGYDEQLIEFLRPLIATCTSVIMGFRSEKELITAEKEQRLLRQRESAIFETVLDAVISIDSEGTVLTFNPAAEKIFGYQKEFAIGRTMSELIIPPKLRERHALGMERYLDKRVPKVLGQIIELPAIRSDGSNFPVEVSIVEIPESDPPVFTGFLRDITERKQAEEALQKAKEAAETADRAKSEFLAKMSHEIRTPMNVILGMAGLASDLAQSKEQIELLDTVTSNVEALLRVINEILDFSKIEAGEMSLSEKPFFVVDLFEEVLESLSVNAHGKELELIAQIEPTLPLRIFGDPQLLRQILVNIIGNAVKFTDQGHIILRLESRENVKNEPLLYFSVQDTGIGIHEDTLEQVFSYFYQVDSSTSRRYGGTGLGLSICKALVEVMGGRIWVTSELGKGSTFHVELPLEEVETTRSGVSFDNEIHQDARVLLLSSDDALNLGISQTLESWKICTFIAKPKRDLLEVLQKHKISHFFIDDRLPVAQLMSAVDAWKRYTSQELSPFFLLVRQGSADQRAFLEPNLIRSILRPVTRRRLAPVFQAQVERNNRSSKPRILPDVLAGCLILLVEDNLDSARYIQRVLEKSGASVELANNGLEGIARFQGGKTYDLIVADVEMPELDGIGMAKRVRSLEEANSLSKTPIVVLTAHAVVGFRERCLSAGIDDYLTKPIERGALVEAISKWTHKEKFLPKDKIQETKEGNIIEVLVDPDMLELIPDYILRVSQDTEKIGRLLENEEWSSIRHLAHNLVGTGGSYGFQQISDLGERLLHAARDRVVGEVVVVEEALKRYLASVRWRVQK